MHISVTRLRVRSFVYMPSFLWHAFRSNRQVQRARGFLGGKLLVNSKNVYWTLTSWESAAAMNEFRTAAAHGAAMPKLMEMCDEASVGHWSENSAELPSWQEAHRRMVGEGRLSKVTHPSPDQLAKRIAAPEPGRAETILKPMSRRAAISS